MPSSWSNSRHEPRARVVSDLFGVIGTRRWEELIELALRGCASLSVLTTVGIIAVLLWGTIAFFEHVPLSRLLLDTEWAPLSAEPHFGIGSLVAGTALTTALATLVALPLGLLAAIYLSEFAPPLLRQMVKPALEVLAGIPTVVFGYFALVAVTPMLRHIVPGLAGFNALSPGIVMGVMIMPMIASLSEDAIDAVPHGLREGALALGATRLRCIFSVVLPSARSGIASALLLAVSRAIGETMIVPIAAGQRPQATLDPRVPIETLTAFVMQVSTSDACDGTPAYHTIFVVGALLFLMTLGTNVASHSLARRARRRAQ